MNIQQPQSSYQEQPQNTECIWGISNWVDYIEQKWLKLFKYTDNDGSTILTIIDPSTNQIAYAFHNSKVDWRLEHINKFKLWTLRAKWHSEKKQEFFISKIAIKKNLSIINNQINKYEKSQSSISSKEIVKNPDFPDGIFLYKNQYWKEFKVETLWWKAVSIMCDNNYVTWHQKGAITRAINENRLEKFEEFTRIESTQLSVIDNTNKILEWDYLWKEPGLSNVNNTEYYERIRQKIIDSSNLILSADYIENIYSQVEGFTKSDLPSINQYEAAENFILIMYKRTWVDTSTISNLLQTGATIHYMFDNIDESIKNEWYDINFVQVLLQLSGIIKNIFLAMVSEEKRAYH
jgi:hypothetical protein